MSVVYLARQIRLNRPCALKMILGGDHASSEAILRSLVEAEAVAIRDWLPQQGWDDEFLDLDRSAVPCSTP